MAQISVEPAIWSSVLLPGALVTLGAGLAFPAITVAATAGVPRSESGLASGVVNTSRQVGGSLGLAALATLAADHAAALTQAGHAVPVALTGGFGLAFAGGAVIAMAAALSGVLVPGPTRSAVSQRRVTQSEPEEAAA
jgi:sugar phosphate permease